ncbi:hypothetical protein [Actinoplanes derwentensis]|uniref:Lipoprotein LprG n=1 Tax=Actinoplanes derwentensis TaxID=113562 RepID=A0A1H1Q7N9_9ACTN|nr:hypothetical protein [Actinoplanes derwentensis]GID82212.1 hypothetical protein Ade03nite_11360 [Actinoplanes derwentensis]SDS19512.1 hypothetical protein SAMN04489716_0229 [Actinoplanes derwentensis]
MKPYRPVLLAISVVLLAGGCTTPLLPPLPAPGSGSGSGSSPAAVASAAPSPSGPDAKQQFVAALEKTRATGYRFAVSGDAVDSQKVTGSGSYDPKAKKISVTQKLSGGGKKTEQGQRIVVGTDLFSRTKNGETWVRLNLKRVKKTSLYYYDMTDPTGLTRFTQSVDTVRSTGANSFAGRLDIEGDKFNEGFLPVGTPAISVWLGGSAQFTATTNAAGWVTAINVDILDDKKTLKMTTKLSNHGRSQGIKKPSGYGEAMDFYYDK